MKEYEILSILRTPHGLSGEVVHTARIEGANLIERYRRLLGKVLYDGQGNTILLHNIRETLKES